MVMNRTLAKVSKNLHEPTPTPSLQKKKRRRRRRTTTRVILLLILRSGHMATFETGERLISAHSFFLILFEVKLTKK